MKTNLVLVLAYGAVLALIVLAAAFGNTSYLDAGVAADLSFAHMR